MRHNRAMWQAEVDDYVAHLRAAGQAASTVRLRQMHLARALTWLALGLPAQVLFKSLAPAFFAREDMTPPLVAVLKAILLALAGALAGIKDGDVLMMHWGIRSRREKFAAVLEPLIVGLKERGFCFATLAERGAP